MSARQKRPENQALIVLNGPLPARDRYRPFLREGTIVLCADGGADRALAANLRPDFVVGDLDSISPATRSQLDTTRLIHRPSQDATDLDKTLEFALERGVEEVVVIGVSGGRLDHQIGNLNILEKFSDRLRVTLVDDTGIGQFVRDSWQLAEAVGATVSLFAFRQARGVTTRGFKFPLNQASLEWAVNDGLSNEITHSPAGITVESGTLFVFRGWQPDSGPR